MLSLCDVLHCIKKTKKFLKEKKLPDIKNGNLKNDFILAVENEFKTTLLDISEIEIDIF